MLSFRRAALGATALAAVLVPLLAGPADASAEGEAQCPPNRFCLYKDANFYNGIAIFDGTDRDQSDNTYSSGGKVVNSASSMVNNTNHQVNLWNGQNGYRCSGDLYIAQPNSTDPNFTDNTNNDRVSCLVYK